MCTFNLEIPVLTNTWDPLSYRDSLVKLFPSAHWCQPLSLQFLSLSWLRRFKSLNPTVSPAFISGPQRLGIVFEPPHPPSSSQDYLKANIKDTHDMEILSSCLTLPWVTVLSQNHIPFALSTHVFLCIPEKQAFLLVSASSPLSFS